MNLSLSFALSATLLLGTHASDTAEKSDEKLPNVSGGVIQDEQAAFDVLHYELDLRVDPSTKRIKGKLRLEAAIVERTDAILMHLDESLTVTAVRSGEKELPFERDGGRLRIVSKNFFMAMGEEDEFQLTVHYEGEPRVAPNPPWKGGFTWAETEDGSPWIATSCQGEGGDLWWPCKDHPSDEPNSMSLNITVPDTLVVATNGKFMGIDKADEGWSTYRWHVSTPINNYGVALNIAPYKEISREFTSTGGDSFPVSYWVLPENFEKGKVLFEEIIDHLEWFESVYGPYPFRADKYGVAETPHLGMEHQTIIAYGNKYRGNIWGPKKWKFDSLHHHELAHEWWGNLVTARSWEDMWIHEGFGTYAQALYVEHLHGRDAYHEQMAYYNKRHGNKGPVAPRRTMNTQEVYFGQKGDSPGGDIYNKGACVLHTLRWYVGDESMMRVLRRMAYPDPATEKVTDGSQCRFSDTDEFLAIAEKHTGVELDWFFEVYLRQPKLPVLQHEVVDDELQLSWQIPGDLAFPMPVEVVVGGESMLFPMKDGKGSMALGGKEFDIDPKGWLLRGRDSK